MLVIRQQESLQFVGTDLKTGPNQECQIDLQRLNNFVTYGLLLFALLVLVDEVAILEVVLEQINTSQHFDGLFGVETLRNVDVDGSLEEYVNDHPVCLVLRLLVAAVARSKPQELEDVGAVNILRQFLDELLL